MSAKEMGSQIACALCGLPVQIHGFTLQSPHGEKKFCCAGCLSIYQLFHGEQAATPTSHVSPKEKS